MTGPTDADIRRIFLANGFTVKPGESDLKPYVYRAARELALFVLAASARAEASEPLVVDGGTQRLPPDVDAAHTAFIMDCLPGATVAWPPRPASATTYRSVVAP